jgi:hypothetical protein
MQEKFHFVRVEMCYGVMVCFMRMRYSHTGRQFFFTTLTLKGRPAALSRLVVASRSLELLPPGEVVQGFFRAIHSVFPYLTLSNYVIMPDHIHFLLIANYDLAPTFNPMWLSFVLIEAIEAAWGASERRLPAGDPVVLLAETVKRAMQRLEAHKERRKNGDFSVEELLPQSPSSLQFDRRAFIELSFNTQQLKAIRRYIRLNPARAIWKKEHPDRFQCFPNIRHRVLDPARRWSAIGNLTLLGSPFLFHVRLSFKPPLAVHEAAIREFVDRAKRGEIPVSGFISPGERELLRRLKEIPNARYIKMLPCALPPRHDPSAEDSQDLAADRMLILSGFPDTPAISTREMHCDSEASHQFRQNCLDMNDLIVDLCQRARKFDN